MNARLQIKTLVRLVVVIVVGSVATTFLAGPRADAASDGYGVTVDLDSVAADVWHHPSLHEGRAVVAPKGSQALIASDD